MEENTERDEVYEQFMQDLQAKKKRQVKRTIREVIMVVIILGVIGFVVWFLTDPEASEKVSLRKEKSRLLMRTFHLRRRMYPVWNLRLPERL